MQASLKITYLGGDADNHRLKFYDGSTSIQGFSQALHIATHAYVNGKSISKAPALKGAELYMKSLRPGSVIGEIVVLINQNPGLSLAAGGIFATYTANPFYDFIKMLFSKANGLIDYEPETVTVSKALERHEPFFDNVAEIMEGSLQRVHRPIGEGIDLISIGRPRSDLITLNQATKDWVNSQETAPNEDVLTGNVTRYNAITRNGRIYIDQLNRIVPFRIDESFPLSLLTTLTWSLHGSNSGVAGTQEFPKKLTLTAKKVVTSSSRVKRIIITNCEVSDI